MRSSPGGRRLLGVLDFERGSAARCVVNISGTPFVLDSGWTVALASAPVSDGALPHDAAAWLIRE